MGSVRRLPMFPLSSVLFPGADLTLHVFEPRYRVLTAECLRGDGAFGVVLIARGSEVGGGDERVDVGTVAHIDRALDLPDGRWLLRATGRVRVRVVEWLAEDPYPLAMVEDVESGEHAGGTTDIAGAVQSALAAVRRMRGLLSELGAVAAAPAELGLSDDPDTASWQLCALAPLTPLDCLALLRLDDTAARLAELSALCDALAQDLRRLLATGSA
jgi:uncharacterized protein